MKTIFVVGLTLALTGLVQAADDVPPGLEKKGGVPPGLQKKGGLPPGQAKKQQAAATPATAPATTTPPATPATPAAPATAPAPAPATPATPAPPQQAAAKEPVKEPAKETTATAPKASHYEVKTRLEQELDIIQRRVVTKDLDNPAIKQISRITGVSVAKLHQQQEEYDAGYPGLLLGNLIAKQSNASFKQLITEHKDKNLKWTTVAQRRNVALQPLLDEVLVLKRHLNQVQQQRRS
jgi:hypothetical protein